MPTPTNQKRLPKPHIFTSLTSRLNTKDHSELKPTKDELLTDFFDKRRLLQPSRSTTTRRNGTAMTTISSGGLGYTPKNLPNKLKKKNIYHTIQVINEHQNTMHDESMSEKEEYS